MVNFRLVSKIIGQLLFIEGGLMFVCLLMSYGFGEDDQIPFLISTCTALCVALAFKFAGRNAENNLSRRDAYFVVTSIWLVFSLLGTVPFLVGGYITTIHDAFFECMSGFTTTGSTIIDDIDALPHGILFWRSLMHWIGGLGIVFFTIAILPSLVGGSIKIFAAEATGPLRTKMHPRISTNAKWLWTMYLGLTVVCSLAFFLAGMGWFDAVNYSMSVIATGGFATHSASVAYFNSPLIDYLCILFQFLAGTNFTLLYIVIFKKQLKSLLSNSEFKLYVVMVAAFTVVISLSLSSHSGYGAEQSVRCALFQVLAFITTTGFYNDDAGLWPQVTWIPLLVCMFSGACAGSTSGGFKCVRIVMLFKVVRNELRHLLHPQAVLPLKINGQTIEQQKISTLCAFFMIYVVMCFTAAALIMLTGVGGLSSLSISASCLGNVGPTLGSQFGPTDSLSALPDAAKWICTALMLAGRLEVMSVLVLFTGAYWKDN